MMLPPQARVSRRALPHLSCRLSGGCRVLGDSFCATDLTMRARIVHVRPWFGEGAHGVFGRTWCFGQTQNVSRSRPKALSRGYYPEVLSGVPERLVLAQ